MNNLPKAITEDSLIRLGESYSNSFLFELISQYIQEIGAARAKEEQAKKKVLELNEILKILNKILRHDILNDLTVVKGNLGFYQQKQDPESLETIKLAVERSISTITRMRELESAVSTGSALKPYQIAEVVKEVTQTFSTLEFSVTGEAAALADEAFKSVIENLVRNALVHGQTKKVEITIFERPDEVEVKVVDFGKGIPDEVKGKLFQEGFKYGETGNTGLGLYIVRKTIERYGGRVWVEDNKPQGTIFGLSLPKVKE